MPGLLPQCTSPQKKNSLTILLQVRLTVCTLRQVPWQQWCVSMVLRVTEMDGL